MLSPWRPGHVINYHRSHFTLNIPRQGHVLRQRHVCLLQHIPIISSLWHHNMLPCLWRHSHEVLSHFIDQSLMNLRHTVMTEGWPKMTGDQRNYFVAACLPRWHTLYWIVLPPIPSKIYKFSQHSPQWCLSNSEFCSATKRNIYKINQISQQKSQ